jgi:acetyl esterase/lipase
MAELDDAYANAAYIPDADAIVAGWAKEAAAFRAQVPGQIDCAYGSSARQVLDLFTPQGQAKGCVIFVHGGYWMRFDKSYWSHLAAGPLARGWAVALLSYDLCPQVTLAEIAKQVAKGCERVAQAVQGPLRLVGHSAGGQLVARMPGLGQSWLQRVDRIIPISPVADLAPLMKTSMAQDLRLNAQVVQSESPVHAQTPDCRVDVVVGADERPSFLMQADALAQVWDCQNHILPRLHHFNVIAGLSTAQSTLCDIILDPVRDK